ncbi:rhythmically expressed gene 2 protein-like [Anopheles bellator]|uniref:rhythmically expressed gene 2 protein-like n=1 Tax=Anopheles bellator TaxID=139047 RepID=UPI002647C814|nr:rhythmically expressed gene 2 protein-like [Anopheles bellator]XP_058064458.1 rhythmically expressed gene 2 protein-like [Anopheles bellator]
MNNFRSNLLRFKLITFDVTDTLLEYAMRPERYYAQTITSVLHPSMGLSIDEKSIANVFSSSFRMLKTKYPNFGHGRKQLEQDVENWHWWWRMLVERVILDVTKRNRGDIPAALLTKIADQLIDDYMSDTHGVCWKKRSGVDEFLRKLKYNQEASAMSSVLGIVSNFDPRLERILRNNHMYATDGERGMDFIVTSYEAGVEKPDPAIFGIALEKAKYLANFNIHPHEALHIGNLCREDYLGARAAGWHALLVNMTIKHRDEVFRQAVPLQHMFPDIPELLTSLDYDPTFPW